MDLSELLASGGVFVPIAAQRTLLARRVNLETQTIEWPGGIDLDADVLYGNFQPASGVCLRRRTVHERTTSRA